MKEQIDLLLSEWTIQDLYDLGPCTDPKTLMLMDILAILTPVVHSVDYNLFMLTTCKLVLTTLQSGSSAASCVGYVYYGFWLVARNEFKRAAEFGELAFNLSDQHSAEVQAHVATVYASTIYHWTNPLIKGVSLLNTSYHTALHSGQIVFAGQSALYLGTIKIWIGQPLGHLYAESIKIFQFISQKVPGRDINIMMTGNVRLLMMLLGKARASAIDGDSDDTDISSSDETPRSLKTFKEEQFERQISDPNNATSASYCWYMYFKLMGKYLMEKYDDALRTAITVEKLTDSMKGIPQVTMFYFYYSLTLAALYDSAPPKLQAHYLSIIQKNQEELKVWALNSPVNFMQQYNIVGAELARIQRNNDEAQVLYDNAMLVAHQNGFVHHEALAFELASRYYLGKGITMIGSAFLKQSLEMYEQWGAYAKVKLLQAQYESVLPPAPPKTVLHQLYATTASQKRRRSAQYSQQFSTCTDSSKIDVVSVVRASQVLSQEILVENVLQKFMHIVVENAGADRIVLVLVHPDKMTIKAHWDVSKSNNAVVVESTSTALRTGSMVPKKVAQYVAKTMQSVVIRNPGKSDFASDAYLQLHRPGCIMCAPVQKKGNLIGIIYLENSVAVNSFTHNRLTVLDLMCSQLAISLENAELYDSVFKARTEAEAANAEKDVLLAREQEARLRIEESEVRYRTLAESTPQLLWITDRDGILTFCNSKFSELLGPNNTSWFVKAHPDDYDRCKSQWQRSLKTHEALTCECRLQNYADSSYSWFLIRSVPIEGADGHVVEWFGTCTDIDYQKRAEAAEARRLELELSEKRYRLLAETIPQIVWTATAEGWIDYFNERFYKFTGATPEDTQGWGWMCVIHEDDHEKMMQLWRDALEQEHILEAEVRMRCYDSSYRWHLNRATPVRDENGKVMKWFGTATDIEDQKRAEQEHVLAREAAVQAVEIKAAFVANMSHEIRTPIHGIQGMAHLLLDSILTSEQREHITTIQHCSDGLLHIINDVLNFSKMEAGKTELQNVVFSIDQVMEGVGELMISLAAEKGIGLYFIVDSDIPAKMLSDPGRLHQILVNLIGNAIKFTEQGEVVTTCKLVSGPVATKGLRSLSSGSIASDEAVVMFEVKDTGCGIMPDHQERLFTPFFQADAGLTREHGGTGLGLAICKQLVQLFGGTISVSSEHKKGSTFSFTVKMKKVADAVAAPSNKFENTKILAVSNTPSALQMYDHIISTMGMQYTSCTTSPADIVEALGDQSINVILTDVATAEQSREIISSVPPNHKLKSIIVLTNPMQKTAVALSGELHSNVKLMVRPLTRAKLLSYITSLQTSTAPRPKVELANEVVGTATALDLSLKDLNVLVVEDNLVNVKCLVKFLEKLGLKPVTALNGLEAISQFASHPLDFFSLILMDCHMPKMDGFQASTEIRKMEEGRSHVPIVALTANVMPGITDQCTMAGMDYYISKPFNFSQLEVLVKGMIKKPQ